MSKKSSAVLIVGGGVAGIQSALDLAESGYSVLLVDNHSNLGGRLPQLDKQFPTNDCGMCKMLPFSANVSEVCLKRGILHPNVEFTPNAEVVGFSGSPGDFSVTINEHNQYVLRERCIGCGLCVNVCPVEVKDEFNESLSTRKAIYVRCLTSIPNKYIISLEHCTKCGECVKVCPTTAIDLSLGETKRTINVGAVILSPGFEEFDPSSLEEYGYNRFSNVMTSTQLERALSSSGPYVGKFVRPSDNTVPKKVAFLQCVGSRDKERNYCSSACCMYAMKEATLLKEVYPDTDVQIFFMDLRTFGKDYYRYYKSTENKGIKFIRCRVPAIEENPNTKDMRISYETEAGGLIKDEFNLVVLSVGQCPHREAEKLANVFGIELNNYGFCKTEPLSQIETGKEGIYVCGSFHAPVAIQEAIIQGSAAANKSTLLLSREVGLQEASVEEKGEEKLNIGVFICECGKEISQAIDTATLVEFVKELPGVSISEKVDYLCLNGASNKIKQSISNADLNRIIFGVCAPYRYEPLFVKIVRELGITQDEIDIVDLREGIAWVHRDKVYATNKAKKLLSMSYEKLRHQEQLPLPVYSVVPRVLVIGGGISGLMSALSLAQRGVEVDLIEKTSELGGNMRDIYTTFADALPQKFLNDVIDNAENNKQVHIHKNAEIKKVNGYAGDFYVEFASTTQDVGAYRDRPLRCGAIIIATGAKEYEPKEYLYGKDERVLTQKELEKRLSDSKFLVPNSVVMIQCVGSRDEEHPYCSRVCCSSAIENAIKLKEKNPNTNIYILYRDIMTYGFREEYYTSAREAGIFFIRYNLEDPPKVDIKENKLYVQIKDPILDELVLLNPDLLVLSTGMVPNNNKPLAEILDVPLNKDGFFEEANIKFRPIDFTTPGVFVCGLAHSPMFIEEAISSAIAACGRAMVLLSKSKPRICIAEVKERFCAACGLCVSACMVNARVIDEIKKVAVVREAFCQGCGECVTICPSGATKLRGYIDKQIFSMIDAAL